jgi:2-methylisocitrate lyase-like PEP mutase family enzyme
MSRPQPLTPEKRDAFKQLHTSGCFVIPNPWDTGSARLLEGLGFKALATTSSGYAWSLGQADGSLNRDAVLAHLRVMVAATSLPVNADFEGGFAADAQGVAQSVGMALDTGVAGLSIEDASGDAENPVRPLADAVARLRAARAAVDQHGGGALLVGRAENFFLGRPDLADTLLRLKAYSEAGADVLYAPGLTTAAQVSAVVAAVAPKPVNLLISSAGGFTVQEAATLGVRRISVGGALARAALGGFMQAARAIAEEGRFDEFAKLNPKINLNEFMRGYPPSSAL